ncbi:S-layer homology domain-containing protein [Arthrobacter sp. NPDC080031]|uniref:S-layer homology domain-containing protein n=1 Tax=Arthrobacter sp. NPDC080031 TaxID=3155918 RepID=UPI00344CBF59
MKIRELALTAALITSLTAAGLACATPVLAASVCTEPVGFEKYCSNDGWKTYYPVRVGLLLVGSQSPQIDGAPVVGNTLHPVPFPRYQFQLWDSDTNTLLEPEAVNVTITYQWRADSVDIPGAVDDHFTLTAAEQGKKITLGVHASVPASTVDSYDGASQAGTVVLPAGSPIPVAPVPTGLGTFGTPTVGGTLFVTDSTNFDLNNGTHLSWLRDGMPVDSPISHGTGYVTTVEDIGKHLSLQVLTYKPGYNHGTAVSPATAPVDVRPGLSIRDVPPGTQFSNEIVWMYEAGISTGWSDYTYRPLEPVHRDAMAAFMYRLMAKPSYTSSKTFIDVSAGTQFYNEITWAGSVGVSTGYADQSYQPLGTVNRDAMAAFMYRLAGSPAYAAPAVSHFKDVQPGTKFYKEINWMYDSGLSTGYTDGTYQSLQPVNRDAMAAFMYRFHTVFHG